MSRKIVIVANGQIESLDHISAYFENAFIISVDGGLNHLDKLRIKPDVLIGDFDSVKPEILRVYEGVQKYVHPTRKDRTDLEIAIDYAIEMNPCEVILLGVTGHRIDHMITNIHLLKRFKNHGILAYVIDFYNTIFYGEGSLEISGCIGDLLSIVPLSESVTGIKTSGLEYPLVNETLYFHESRGVSNVLISEKIRIKTESGEFLVILSKD